MAEKKWNSSVIVAKEKHSTNIWCATTRELFHASALQILTSRAKNGYWYPVPDTYKPINEPLTDEDIARIPDHSLRGQAHKRREQQLRDLAYYTEYKAWYEEMVWAVAAQDSTRAWSLLRARSDYEYEGVELEPLLLP